ncbi:sorbitol dehydrogenase-like isoform X2 [Artemia franciscana]|uniref:sorbitol dehydrogenase-like isoform X2 n=1 Tax=Artemia franciscana TaxID=6661 RepID=UPI0032DB0C82
MFNLGVLLTPTNSSEKYEVEEPKENEVLIQMASVGICGSDVHYWTKGKIGDFIVKEPMILGHESGGIVARCGPGVKNLQVGDRVAIEPGVPCRVCEYCKSGRYNLCLDIIFCATPPIHGSLRNYYTHPSDFCYKLPEHVSLEEAALLEPLSVAVHACRRSGVTAGCCVLVLGAGPIGLLNMMVAKAFGATKVFITDISDSRLDTARSLGADYAVNIKNHTELEMIKEIVQATNGGPNITIECCGAEASVRLGILSTKSGGVICLVGCGPDEVKIPIINASAREVDIRGIFRYANCYPIALDLVATGRVNVKPLVTHRFSLSETVKAFETAKEGKGIKIMIKCSNAA